MHIAVLVPEKEHTRATVYLYHFKPEVWQEFKDRSNLDEPIEEDDDYVQMYLTSVGYKLHLINYSFSKESIPVIEHSNFPLPK